MFLLCHYQHPSSLTFTLRYVTMGVLIWLFLSVKGLSGLFQISPLTFYFLLFSLIFFYSGLVSSVPGSPAGGSAFTYFI